jgi:hypothetical protein
VVIVPPALRSSLVGDKDTRPLPLIDLELPDIGAFAGCPGSMPDHLLSPLQEYQTGMIERGSCLKETNKAELRSSMLLIWNPLKVMVTRWKPVYIIVDPRNLVMVHVPLVMQSTWAAAPSAEAIDPLLIAMQRCQHQ